MNELTTSDARTLDVSPKRSFASGLKQYVLRNVTGRQVAALAQPMYGLTVDGIIFSGNLQQREKNEQSEVAWNFDTTSTVYLSHEQGVVLMEVMKREPSENVQWIPTFSHDPLAHSHFHPDFGYGYGYDREIKNLIANLRINYNFKEYSKIENFLGSNSFLIGLLVEANLEICKFFDFDFSLTLSVETDPESQNEEQLFLFIQTTVSVEEALANLDAFDDGWWLENLNFAKGMMVIDVEYL